MERVSFYTEIGKNKRDSVMLVGIILAVLLVIIFVISEAVAPGFSLVILLFAGIFVMLDAWASMRFGDKVVISAAGAKPADPVKHAYFVNTVEGLALAAGIPAPKAFVIPSTEINAFATGRDPQHASIAVTQGALDNLNRQELEGVVAHEMSHIGNYDIRFFTLVAVFVGLIAIISHIFLRSMMYSGSNNSKDKGGGALLIVGIILAIIAPIVVKLVQLSISRKREYLADATGVKLTRYPPGLAGALEKIKNMNKGNMKVSDAVQHLYISDPHKTALDSIFATHPPIEKRIEKLRAM